MAASSSQDVEDVRLDTKTPTQTETKLPRPGQTQCFMAQLFTFGTASVASQLVICRLSNDLEISEECQNVKMWLRNQKSQILRPKASVADVDEVS